jgi:hypothetical protein
MENKTAISFTMLVLLAGTTVLSQEGYFSKTQQLNPMIFGDMAIKVVFDEDTPELVAYVPPDELSTLPTLIGDPVPEEDSMTLGYYEALDMAEENNITGTQAIFGYDVDEDFIGKTVRITGMLKKTSTLIDMMHVLPKDQYDSLPPGDRIYVKFTEDKMPKFFYYIKPDGSNWPKKIGFEMGGLDEYERLKNNQTLATIELGGLDLHINKNRVYLPLVLGSDEAKMMIDEGLFSKPGDRIEGFFGKDVVIAGVLKPTGTVLDMFHYMPEA